MNIFCSPTLSATSWKSNSPQLLIGWLKILHDSSTFFWLHSFSRVGQWTSNSWSVKPKTRHFMSLPESHSKGSLPPQMPLAFVDSKVGCLHSIRNLTPHELRVRVFCSKWPLPSLSTSLIQWTNSSSAGHCPKQRMAVPNSLVEMEPPPSKSLERTKYGAKKCAPKAVVQMEVKSDYEIRVWVWKVGQDAAALHLVGHHLYCCISDVLACLLSKSLYRCFRK